MLLRFWYGFWKNGKIVSKTPSFDEQMTIITTFAQS